MSIKIVMIEKVPKTEKNAGYDPCYGQWENTGKELRIEDNHSGVIELHDDEILELYNGLRAMVGNH